MRPQFVWTVVLLALGLLALLALASKTFRSPSAVPATETQLSAQANQGDAAIPKRSPRNSAVPNSAVLSEAPDPAVHQAYVERRVTELNNMAMCGDAASRDTLLSEMTNPDPAIRQAALAATIQFGDHSVIPRLKEIEAQTEDASEKQQILQAINFMSLPTLTEVRAQGRPVVDTVSGGNTNRLRGHKRLSFEPHPEP